ncbi:M16 family metallopeptidase [Xanthovirga aplysinae]|uniref:M16 family metallopeptidase n=1 Tax=Xanthovirga aplysinae TaxID=2529853 RepID=UPI0012BB8637|nr:pitrilysin family protein [Xanthovirga aplysinae]MTI30578.1 insulinase family protein [Xanthovirga aplysinae]
MNKKSILFLLLMIPLMGLQAQDKKIEFQEYDLENGLHVILHQDKSTPIVAVSMMYHVGSKNEKPGLTGFAHFFEHLLFEGSENVQRGEFDKYISNAGGMNNANTSWDRTYYYEVLPSNQLKLGLWLESERLMHAKVEKKGIETQREVVKEERRLRVDNQPYGTVMEQTFKHAYNVHPYRWPIIGSMEDLNNAKDEDFVNFYKTFYVPQNAVLSIAGDIDFEDTKKWIAEYFADIPAGKAEIPRPTEVEPAQTAEVRDVVYDNIQLPAVVQGFHIPAQGTKDYYAVSMLAQILSQGQSSRLNKALVEDQQKALQVGAFPLDMEDPGLTIAFAITNMGVKPEDVEAAMEAEYDKLKKELISEREYQKLQNQIENDFVSANTTAAGIAENLANYYMYYGNSNLINTEIERYREVSREDIRKAANTYLTKENRVTLYYLPKQEQNN